MILNVFMLVNNILYDMLFCYLFGVARFCHREFLCMPTRVVNYWNRLPVELKLVKTVVDFKIGLEAYKKDNISKQGNYWDLSDEIFSQINDSNRESLNVVFMQENKYIAKRRGLNTSQCV